MVMSGRAKRMEKHHKRNKGTATLNLVSLMDIFTILVFFLLVNSQQVEVLPNAKDLELPQSNAEQKSRETVVIMVTDEQILVQGRVVANVADVIEQDDLVIAGLKTALQSQTDRVLRRDAKRDIAAREVTIIGDKALPYRLLKRVMATCMAADYGQISLAVLQRAPARQAATNGAARG